MKEIPIKDKLSFDAVLIKGMLKAEDTYINSIENKIREYVVLYGIPPLIHLEYLFDVNKGLLAINLKVLNEQVPGWVKATN